MGGTYTCTYNMESLDKGTKGRTHGQDREGRREISSRDSESCSMQNLQTVYFWNLPCIVFGLRLTMGK